MINKIILIIFTPFMAGSGTSQLLNQQFLIDQIKAFKNDPRGPYKDIRWFCKDGSVRMPKEPCPDSIGPGVQHARYKDAIVELGNKNHIFLKR